MDKKDLRETFALLVPCYNAENYVDNFLANIAALNKPFDEVIFYNDASTDNTYNLLKSKGANVLMEDINRGPGYARNKLAENTSCSWFHFHDIDDALSPDYLIKTSEIIKNVLVDVVLCNVDWHSAETNDLVLSWKYSNKGINMNPVAYAIAHPIGGINGLYKKSKFIETGGFNTQIRIWEDADFHVKLAAAGAVFYVIEEVLSYSHRYSQSASTDQSIGWVKRLELLKKYAETFAGEAEQQEIGKQLQVAAGNLVLCNQVGSAKRAFQLSELCKVAVPYNNSKLWRLLKWVLPPFARINLRLLQFKIAFRKPNLER